MKKHLWSLLAVVAVVIQTAGSTLAQSQQPTKVAPMSTKQQIKSNLEIPNALSESSSGSLAKQYGILFELPAPIVPIYRDKLKLATYNGNDKMELPLAATYVIDKNGRITYAFLDADYKKRAEPADVIAAIKAALAE